jgi:uncharacterized membrane protein (DUF485 family)
MQKDIVERLRNNPKYHEMVSKRSRFGWMMAILMLVVYYAFIMTIAFAPQVLGQPISNTSVITVGIPIGLGVIVFAFLLTGIYVYRANTVFDRMNEELKKEVL